MLRTTVLAVLVVTCLSQCLVDEGWDGANCTPCLTNQFSDGTTTCSTCTDPSCSGCTGANNICIACAATYHFMSNGSKQCALNCNPNEFVDASNTCTPCDPACASCSTQAVNCDTCQSGYYWPSNASKLCVSACETNEYLETITCTVCPTGCTTCEKPSTTVECTSCSTAPGNEYYYYQTLCYRPCPIKTFPSLAPTPNCTDCDAPCAKCSGNYQNCSSCIASYHFPSSGSKLCVPSCESNEYLNVLSNTCTVCPTGCTTCQKPSTTVECTSCSTVVSNEYYYYQTLCYQPCPTKTFPVITATRNCTDCDAPCAECSDNYQNCSSCIASYHFPSSGSTLCVGNCQSDEYVEATANLCTACPTGCATCQKSSTTVECTDCTTVGPDQYYFYLMVCYSPCPTHTFPQNTTSSNCTDCDAVCAECWANAQNCSTCAASHYFPSNGSSLCVPSCESNEYLEVLSNTCTVCPTGCTACEKPSTTVECTSCSTVVSNEYYYYQTLCYQPCPTHTFPSLAPTPNCTDCDVACADCTLNSTNCGSCTSSYYFPSNGSSFCVSACETNQFVNTNITTCQPCPDGCGPCSMPLLSVVCSDCIVFVDQHYLYHGWCYSPCPSHTFPVNGTPFECFDCDVACGECWASNVNCSSCASNYYWPTNFSTLCVDTCQSNEYKDYTTGRCTICPTGCGTCEMTTDTHILSCTHCILVGPDQYYLNDGACVTTCPIGRFKGLNVLEPTCLNCSSNCHTCQTTLTHCTSCSLLANLQSYMYSDSVCYVTCPNNTYPQLSVTACLDCNASCSGCYDSIYNCISCSEGYFRIIGSNACTQICSQGQYGNSTSKTCTACPVGCYSCSGETVCSVCTAVGGMQYYLEGSSCKVECSSGLESFDPADNYAPKCLSCAGNCLTCQGSPSFCLSCTPSNVLIFGLNTCSSACLQGQYQSSSGFCSLCNDNCQNCSASSTTCTSCGTLNGQQSYLHSDAKCYSVCPNGYYGAIATNSDYVCTLCDSTCDGCNLGPTNCLACKNSSLFFKIGSKVCTNDCGTGYYGSTSTGSCQVCPTGCTSCSDNGTSLICAACQAVAGVNYYLLDGNCNSDCPLSGGQPQYEIASNLTCGPCDSTCLTCSGSSNSNCLSCASGEYLTTAGVCNSTSCPEGEYAPASSFTCKICSVSCLTCSSASVCTSCGEAVSGTKLFLHSGSCLMTCPIHYYADSTVNKCTGCHSSCLACRGPSETDCISCSSGSLLQTNSSCVTSCGYGNYSSNNLCYPCPQGCKSCLSSTNCTDCMDILGEPFYLDDWKCLRVCPNDTYADYTSHSCLPCDSSCLMCQDSPTACLSCLFPLLLTFSTSQCLSLCPDGQYNSPGSTICLLCDAQCQTCNASNASVCLTCGHQSTGLQLYLHTDHQCYLTCPKGYFGNTTTYKCDACLSTCNGCTLSNINCILCSAGSFRQVGSKQCGSCPTGYYGDNSTSLCTHCPVGCAECSSASVCSKCTQIAGVNYYLNATACLSICPTGTLGITDGSGDLVCTACTGPCATCSGAVDQCLSCASGNFLYYGEKICNSSCPQGFYNLTDKCKPCSIYCKTCSDSMSNCQSCLTLGGQSYYLSSNSCIPTCPDSTYGDTVSLWCLPCAPGCLTCFGPNLTRCYSCSSTGGVDYFLISGSNECSQTCPSTMYYHNSTLRCLACPLTCSTCSDDGLTCSSCSYSPALGLNLYLAPARDSCLVKCPPGYWPNTTVYECQVCNEGCSNCFRGTSSQCTACANSSGTVYYLGIASTICNTSCPSGQYVSQYIPFFCQPCSPTCQTCEYTADNCTSSTCSPNYFYLNHSCLSLCPDNYYPDSTLRQCGQCAQGCQNCYGSGIDQCSSCLTLANGTEYFLQYELDTCLLQCDPGQFGTNHRCWPCQQACRTCSTYSICLSCQSVNGLAYYLNGTQCLVDCGVGLYGLVSNYSCMSCPEGCASCQGSTLQQCLSCSEDASSTPFFLWYGTTTCSSTCPSGQYKNATSHLCLLCNLACLTCASSEKQCTSCGSSVGGQALYLFNSQCLVSCPRGYWGNLTDHACWVCSPGCAACTSSGLSSCLECTNVSTTAYYKYIGETVCNTTCPDGQFISASIPFLCQPCSSTCVTCSNTPQNCTNSNCTSNYYYLANSCLSQCPDNYYPDTALRQCIQCTDGCQTCPGSGLDQCTHCKVHANTTYYYLSTSGVGCSPSCLAGSYPDSSALICRACNSVCATCSDYSTCQSCLSLNGVGYFLQGSTCTATCPTGKYGQISNHTCSVCFQGCASCDGPSAYTCWSCKLSTAGDHYYLIHNTHQCNLTCPNGQYQNITNHQCMLCSTNCLTCNYNATYCTSCPFSVGGIQLYLLNNTCTVQCQDGLYRNTTNNLCTACDSACLTCLDSTRNYCLKCGNVSTTQYYLTVGDTICSTSCPLGQYIDPAYPNNCRLCSDNCVGCQGTPGNCTLTDGCKANQYFNNATNSCVLVCPDGTFPNVVSRFCENCSLGCELCYGAAVSKCTRCRNETDPLNASLTVPYFRQLNKDLCVSACATGEYGDVSTFQCFLCDPACRVCTGPLVCQSCQSVNGVAYYLNLSSCLAICPSDLFGNSSSYTCDSCPSECASCFGSLTTQCLACKQASTVPYFLIYGTNTCSGSCPDGQYSNATNYLCMLCQPQCLTCQYNSTHCLTCGMSGFGIELFLYNYQCLLACPDGYWKNSTGNTCDACHQACSLCYDGFIDTCTRCRNVSTLIYYKQIGADVCNTSCPGGQFIAASVPNYCQPCSPVCITCENAAENCTNLNCSVNYFYLNNSCLATCPDNYYTDSSLRQCLQCSPGCQTCFGPGLDACSKCNSLANGTQYFLQIGKTTCGPACSSGEFPKGFTGQCTLCNPACGACTSSTVCQSCQSVNGQAFYLQSSGCVFSCPVGKYGNLSTWSCEACAGGCASCFGSSSLQCSSCTLYNSTDYFLVYKTTYCDTSCPAGQYKNASSHQCLLCSIMCLTCSATATNCLTCGFSSFGADLYFRLNQCLLTCPLGFWPNITNHNCDACNEVCSVCYSSDSLSCSKCRNKTTGEIFYKQIGADICAQTCPDGQFISVSVPNYCQKCSPVCITCSNTAQNCTSTNCSANYFFLNNSCLSACPDNYYPDTVLRQCIQCTPGCQSCYGPGLDACTKCTTLGNGTVYYLQLGLDSCRAGCNPGEYGYNFTGQCEACSGVCSLCTEVEVCQKCQSVNGRPYYLSGQQCLAFCPPGEFGNLTSLQCLTCPTGCDTCFAGSSDSCYSCKEDTLLGVPTHFFLIYSTTICSVDCPDGQYSNSTSHQCRLCNVNCLTCVNASTTCLSCGFSSIGATLFLYGSSCLLTCPSSYYPNSTLSQCLPCALGCSLCSGATANECSQCRTQNISGVLVPYYLYYNDSVCATSCPPGQYVNTVQPNVCIGCDPGCVACSVVSTNCTLQICSSGYYYLSSNSSCLKTCPLTYYPNTGTGWCTNCLAGCQLCYGGSLLSCTKCKVAGTVPYFKQMDIDTCASDCPVGQWGDPSTLSCLFCNEQCLSCNISASDCQTCNNVSGIPYFNHQLHECLLQCYLGYYGQISNNSCIACWIGCAECFKGDEGSCTKCRDAGGKSYLLAYGSTTCGESCPSGQFSIPSLNACYQCDVNCYTCSGSSKNCTSCYITSAGLRLYLQGNACVQTCTTGTYQRNADSSCQPCEQACLSCTGPSLLLCLSCNNITNSTDNSTLVYYLYIGNSVCSLECPLGQYIRTGYPNACQQCAVECVGCIGISTNCTQQDRCTLGYYFYRPTNSCIESCPEGYYASATTQFCEACAAGCSLCQDAGLLNCQSCKQDLSSNTSFFKEISHDWCVSECLPGEYAMESDLKCHSCDLTCVLCSGAATVCQQCRNVSGVNYFHYADACLKSCPNGYYGEPSNNTCVSCHPACALCFGPSTSQCSACRPDTTASPAVYYYLHYSTTICDLVCPYGQYAVNGSFTCDPCNMNCATCVTTSTFCLSCTYINSISIVYLFANKCIIACPSGTWHNSTQELNHECSTCHPYCTVCAGPSNEECSSCGNSSTNGSIYYLHINSTVCQETCPNGQYIALAVPNLCQSCSSTCVRCSSTPTYCQQCSFNYFLHAPTSTCSQTCPAGYFNDPIITVNYYVCSPCPTGCATCTGPSNDQCLTCNNASLPDGSIQSYFKEVIGTNCVAQCSTVGYYGNPVTNLCQNCQTGCVSCQGSASYCFSCKTEGGHDYFKPRASNSCATICPDGEYGNLTDHQCHECIYYTLSGACVLACPTGYFPQVNNSKTICQNCSDPSAVGNPCNRSYTFQVQTTVINNGEDFQHKIYLPNGLSSNVTAQQLLVNLSVAIEKPYRRRLQEVVRRGRLLGVSIPLTVKGLTISDDRTVIFIITNFQSTDFSVADIVVNFPATALVAADGLLYQSTTATYALSDPIFQQTYYQTYSKNVSLGAEGIVFLILSVLLLVFQLVIANRKGYHQMMAFIMLLQVMGISRIRQYPINFNIYSVLLGYSYFQLPFIPNAVANVFPPGYKENSLQPVAFALGSHNALLNLCPIFQLFLVIQVVIVVYYILKSQKGEHYARMKLYQQTLVVLFMVIIIYESILVLFSLQLNGILDLSAQYYASVLIGILLLLFYLIYLGVWVRPYRLFQLYKIHNLVRVIGLAILPINRYGGIIVIDIAELVFLVLDLVLYRLEKLHVKIYVIEKALTMAAINASIFANDSLALLIVAGLCIASIFLIKIYYTGVTMKEYLDRKREEALEAVQVPSEEQESAKEKEGELIQKLKQEPGPEKMGEGSRSQLALDSEHAFYKETMVVSDHNSQFQADLTLAKIQPPEKDSENRDSYLPKDSQSDFSQENMIVFVDPDEYDNKLANKKNPPPQARPGTQTGNRGRHGLRTDGMKTATGFYPRPRGPRNQELLEDVEVIMVEKKSDDESDIVSQVSEGGGWLSKNDDRNRMRALQNKTLWKIMDEKGEEK